MIVFRVMCIAFLVFAVFSCNDDEDSVPETESETEEPDYYPMEEREYIYRFDSVMHDPFSGTADTVEGKIKRQYIFHEGNEDLLRVEVSWRYDDDERWRPHSLQKIEKLQEYLLWYRDNEPFALMFFPLKEGREWDGHKFNDREAHSYRYTSVGENFSTPDATHNRVLSVEMENESTFLFEKQKKAVLQDGKGLIYFSHQDEEYQTDHTEGFIYRKWLITP